MSIKALGIKKHFLATQHRKRKIFCSGRGILSVSIGILVCRENNVCKSMNIGH